MPGNMILDQQERSERRVTELRYHLDLRVMSKLKHVKNKLLLPICDSTS